MNLNLRHWIFAKAALAALLFSAGLAACGGGGGAGGGGTDQVTPPNAGSGKGNSPPPSSAATYTISGKVDGLASSGLVLQNNGADDLTISAGASGFTFATPVAANGSYVVTVRTQPTDQTCTVVNNTGTVAAANVTTVGVACSANAASFTIGGTVSGLSQSALVLQDNGGDNLTVTAASTRFAFKTPLTTGTSYAVTIMTQPTGLTCSLADASGTVSTSNITSIAISCTRLYKVGGTLSGLSGKGLHLRLNQGDEFDPLVNGAFQLPAYLADAASYSVTVATQPTSPAQICTVQNGVGAVASADVTSVSVNCLNIGQFVYVVNSTDNASGTVSAFSINPATGALTAIGSNIAAHTKPTTIAIDYTVPFVPIVYVANATSKDLTEFDFKTVGGSGGAAGALNNLGNTDAPGQGPASITIAPSGSFLFSGGYGSAATGTVYGFTLDKNGDPPQDLPSASLTTPGPVLGMTIDPASHWLFATTSSANSLMVYSIATDATLTPVATAPYPTGNDPHGVVVWPNSTAKGGFVYVANRLDSTVSAFAFDGPSGKLQPAGTYSTDQGPSGIAIDPTGSYLYTANSGDGTLSTFTINRSTGALAALGTGVASGNLHPTLSSNPGPVDVKVDPSGQFVYCVNSTDGSLSVFTTKSGALTLFNTYETGAGAAAVAVY